MIGDERFVLRTFELSYTVKNMRYIMLNWVIFNENINCNDLSTIDWEYWAEYFYTDPLKRLHAFEVFWIEYDSLRSNYSMISVEHFVLSTFKLSHCIKKMR